MEKVLSFANFKGGVGKTSTTALVGYNLAKVGKRVLMIDLDAQANLTSLMIKTSSNDNEITTIDKSLMRGITENIESDKLALVIKENLYLIPNAVDFSVYPRYLEKNFNAEIDRVKYLKEYIKPLISKFDYIFLDVPPTLSLLNDTAFYACDQIIVVLQTQERSLTGAEVFIQYLQNTLIDEFNASCDVLGILPVLSKRNARVDEEILELATEEFGEEYIFDHKISLMERVKRVDMTGITDNPKDPHDKKVHSIFTLVGEEILERIDG